MEISKKMKKKLSFSEEQKAYLKSVQKVVQKPV